MLRMAEPVRSKRSRAFLLRPFLTEENSLATKSKTLFPTEPVAGNFGGWASFGRFGQLVPREQSAVDVHRVSLVGHFAPPLLKLAVMLALT